MDEQLEIKIYKNYRAVMRKKIGGFPAIDRQRARKACVERYGVSYKEVKRIVEKHDAINGITHEKQDAIPYWMRNSPSSN